MTSYKNRLEEIKNLKEDLERVKELQKELACAFWHTLKCYQKGDVEGIKNLVIPILKDLNLYGDYRTKEVGGLIDLVCDLFNISIEFDSNLKFVGLKGVKNDI